MRWLLDQGLLRAAASLLRDQGVDAVHVGEIGMFAATDFDISTSAKQESRILVTLEVDFHALLAKSGACQPSVIRLREEGLKGPALSQLVLQLADRFIEQLSSACVLTVTSTQARLRMRPIKP